MVPLAKADGVLGRSLCLQTYIETYKFMHERLGMFRIPSKHECKDSNTSSPPEA